VCGCVATFVDAIQFKGKIDKLMDAKLQWGNVISRS
jgi:hypothetical protein